MFLVRLVLPVAFLAAVLPSCATPIYAGAENQEIADAQQPEPPPVTLSLLRADSSTAGPGYLPDGRGTVPILPIAYGLRPAGEVDEPWGAYRPYAHWPSLVLAAIALGAVVFAWRRERDEEPSPRRFRRVYVVR